VIGTRGRKKRRISASASGDMKSVVTAFTSRTLTRGARGGGGREDQKKKGEKSETKP